MKTCLTIADRLSEDADSLEEAIAMPTVLRSSGFNWGFYSNEEPRMHIQVVNAKEDYKVWLENRGVRLFDPDNKVPTQILKQLYTELQARETVAEGMWLSAMISRDMIKFKLSGDTVTLTVYPGSHNSFIRNFSLTRMAGHQSYQVTESDMRLDPDMAALVVGTSMPETQQAYIRLSYIVFTGKRLFKQH